MAYLGSDGFDNGTLRFLAADYNDAVQVTIQAAGHTGTYALRIEDAGYWVRKAVTGTPDNCAVSVWIDPDANYGDNDGFRIRLELTTGEFIEIRWDAGMHTFDAYVDGVKVADGLIAVPLNDWFHAQLYVFVDNVGFIRTKIDNDTDILYDGDTLPIGAAAQVAYVYLYNGAAGYVYFDDLVWGADEFQGDCRVHYIVPDADTVVDDWLPVVGPSSYPEVDEVPADNNDYLYTITDEDETELDCEGVTPGTTEIVLVSAVANMNAGVLGFHSIELGVDSGGVEDTTPFLVDVAWEYNAHYMETNPNGAIPWTEAAVNALKTRIEAVL